MVLVRIAVIEGEDDHVAQGLLAFQPALELRHAQGIVSSPSQERKLLGKRRGGNGENPADAVVRNADVDAVIHQNRRLREGARNRRHSGCARTAQHDCKQQAVFHRRNFNGGARQHPP